MANTRTESFGSSDPDGQLDYVLSDAPNPKEDYGKDRHKKINIGHAKPAHRYETPRQGRSNGEHLLRPNEAQKGLSEKAVADQQAVNELGVAAARAMLDGAEQLRLLDANGGVTLNSAEAETPTGMNPVDQAGLANVRAQMPKREQGAA